MVSANDVAPTLARAMAHPLRVRIVAALDDGPRGLESLASQVDADRRAVARHARVLEQAGVVQASKSARGTTYELIGRPFFSDDAYESMPQAAREGAVAATLATCHGVAVSALESGGFDRPEIHLSRTALELDDEQWRALSAEFAALLERIESTAPPRRESAADRVTPATAVLMLFERTGAEAAHAPEIDPGPFAIEEGLDRCWQLSEELDRELSHSTTDWAAVVARADQLRVVARAAMVAEAEERRRRDGATAHAAQPTT